MISTDGVRMHGPAPRCRQCRVAGERTSVYAGVSALRLERCRRYFEAFPGHGAIEIRRQMSNA